ncbi:hypothetical protein KDU71_17620 [Carboxylicivirga sediminis]|uniref:Uncharacterized protein n=1 Tax=Carboxylicivirga sediminis TaxID=2006564 RepID=A0A941IY05_9BACT|nr:hypothetical protein [Carboxylicivirga sediminis]MBR8537391.1 hypothetical protein [Carboxylicivirga sediminis]
MKSKKNHIIRRACVSDEQSILDFIETHWSKDHIFLKDKKLFEWQHREGEYLNFLLAENIETGTIDSLLGYVSPKHFDPEIEAKNYWGAIWKTAEGANLGIGISLLRHLKDMEEGITYSAIGISDIAKNIYKVLNYKISYLRHYYLLNLNCEEFNIASIPNKIDHKALFESTNVEIREVKDIDDISINVSCFPTKSINYLVKRFREHPTYKYKSYAVYNGSKAEAIIIIRKQFVGESSCLRIVDIYGTLNEVDCLYSEFQKLLTKENSEYLDCLNYGVSAKIFDKHGFIELDHSSEEVTIPNYFEPFLKKNIRIEFATDSEHEDLVIYKGDADQDRPNQLESI